MGVYLNPGNSGFVEMIASDYVDKTGLIALINATIGTKRKLTCVSRPRRFGKSYAAQMLSAYYDRTCDSRSLFAGYEIAREASFERHLNTYDVIYLDMTQTMGEAGERFIEFIRDSVTAELKCAYPNLVVGNAFSTTLVNAAVVSKNKFIFIIDEWDAPIREMPAMARPYLEFLRTLFKSSNITPKIAAAAYMTGILPIAKDKGQSAVSDFKEYTMIKPRGFARFVGFTEDEVKGLCKAHGMGFEDMRRWYDGYSFMGIGSVNNPNSVMQAIDYEDLDSYWTETSSR